MNEVAKQAPNYWEAYGEAASNRNIVGKLLKFSKGDWLAGMDNETVPEGTLFVANMDEMLVGWIRWEDSMPKEHAMGRVSSGYQPSKRKDLGDIDEADWELDESGKPRDPWQFTNYLVMVEAETGQLYTFTTSSKGGLGAVGELCKAFGRYMRQHPDVFPVVEIGVSSYQHRDRTRGRIKVPTFKIIRFEPKAKYVEALAAANSAEPSDQVTEETTVKPDPEFDLKGAQDKAKSADSKKKTRF